MSSSEYNYDEPWSIFEDEEKPWQDMPRLIEWEKKLDTQMEMGDAFGCTPSTISYWLNKAHDEVEFDHDIDDLQCRYHEVCGNLAMNPKTGVCGICLDVARHNNREEGFHPDESEDIIEHMETLYNVYSDFVEDREETFVSKEDKDSKQED